MSSKPSASARARSDRRAHDRMQALKSKERYIKASGPATPCILDAVCDQHDRHWIRYGTPQRAVWFAMDDLISNSSGVFKRLSSVGVHRLTTASQTTLKREVEHHGQYRPALVATRPGWVENFYALGDGMVISPASDNREVIRPFEINPKFAPRGSLAEWQEAVGPFVTGQPLARFGLALALTAPLLRLAPSGYLNPQAEIVGGFESAKTSLGVLAASVWAGDPQSDCGGGEIWALTLNAIDDVKLANRDGFVFFDEGNLAGQTPRERREFIQQAVFKVASTGVKRRMGDAVVSEHAHVALLSTTNVALADLIEDKPEVKQAVQSRMITFRIPEGAPHGAFARLPHGYDNARAASEALVNAAGTFWGQAGRAFVERLVREIARDEDRLKADVADALARYVSRASMPPGSARIQKTIALVGVATKYARQWHIFPKAWGSSREMMDGVASILRANVADDDDPLTRIRAYVDEHRESLIDVACLLRPLSKEAFEAAAGFLRSSSHGNELLVPAARFRTAFKDHEAMMKSLRASRHAQTESGHKSKLTIKTPRAISAEGRVYCICIDEMIGSMAPDKSRVRNRRYACIYPRGAQHG